MPTIKLRPIIIIGILFFVFGFVSWINAILIPYFKMVCELTAAESMMVAFAFYFSYFVMALPSSFILQKIGFKNGMIAGLLVMSVGALIFIPAAMTRQYPLFLFGLFIQATGLTVLQSASNPYVTILGPMESAAKRISIMGICNKVAGAIAPVVLIQAITKGPDEIDQLQNQLKIVASDEKIAILNQLGSRLVVPYILMAVTFIALGLMIKLSHLPDVDNAKEDESLPESASPKTSVFQYPHLWLGAITIFFSVGVEVLAVDSIITYAQHQGYSFRAAKFFATYTLLAMIAGYLIGIVAIPKYIIQRKVLQLCGIVGIIFSVCALLIAGKASVFFIALLGLSNALLWPTIWPLALDGIGKFTKQGTALLIMGIVGGALLPLIYGYLSNFMDPQLAYFIFIPSYLFILFYGTVGYRIGKMSK